MNIFKILSMAFFAILTVLIGMVAYLYVMTELHSDTFVGICAFLITTVFMTMIYCSIRWVVVDAYPKIKKSRKKPIQVYRPSENPGPALEKVLDYTQNDMSEYVRPEDLPTIMQIAKDFVNKSMSPTKFELDRETSGLSPVDILHFGWNIKGLAKTNWTGPQVSRFLKKAFPKILDPWAEETVNRKLTTEDGTFRVPRLDEKS